MSHTTVRITEAARDSLRSLAESEGRSMQDVLERAIENYRRQRFLEAVNAGYAALQKEPDAWSTYQSELALWDKTLLDGLPAEPTATVAAQRAPTKRRPKHERAG